MTFLATAINEDLAEAVGINTFRTKLLSFVVANFFAGLAGGIYASLIGSISPSVASIAMTFNFLMYVLLGGMTTLAGSDYRRFYHSDSHGISAVSSGLSDDFIRFPADCRHYLLPDGFYGIVYKIT